MHLKRHSGLTHSDRFIAANTEVYTHEVRDSTRSPESWLIRATASVLVCRCTSKLWVSGQRILTHTYLLHRARSPLHPWMYFRTFRCSKTAFIEVLFFVWCTLIAQIVLNLRCEVIPLPICGRVLMELQDVRHHLGEQDHHRSLRVCNRHLSRSGVIHGNVGCEYSRYDIYLCGAVVLWETVVDMYTYRLCLLGTQFDGSLPSPLPHFAYVRSQNIGR